MNTYAYAYTGVQMYIHAIACIDAELMRTCFQEPPPSCSLLSLSAPASRKDIIAIAFCSRSKAVVNLTSQRHRIFT